MIIFKNNIINEPYKRIRSLYKSALKKNEKNIQAFLVASYSLKKNEVDSRYVNLKIVDADKWIFFSNYNSPKGMQFSEHPKISTLLFWQSINTQIRMKGNIKKSSKELSKNYFISRSKEKNALAISSDQSKKIDSYKSVKIKYEDVLKNENLLSCPEYWGGYIFTPSEIEFWVGHKNRLNKREKFYLTNGKWKMDILEP